MDSLILLPAGGEAESPTSGVQSGFREKYSAETHVLYRE